MDSEGNFDVVVLGTGLTESITAAQSPLKGFSALSKAGFKVVHLDVNPYYGGDEASLTVDELAQWADRRSSEPSDKADYLSFQRQRFTSISHSETIPDHARHYSVSLMPSLIPSVGPLISSLVASGVSRYGGFRLLERVGIYDREKGIKSVPGSKEDVFKSKEMSLINKRRLMRFLMFASGDFEDKPELQGNQDTPFIEYLRTVFSLDQQVSEAITYALAFCTLPTDPTLPALKRLRDYLRSSGRYGASPFLIGHYGGSGEIAQGFCRVAAVNGGVYILDHRVRSITPPTDAASGTPSSKYVIELDDFPEPFTADIILSSPDHLPKELAATAHRPTSEAPVFPHTVARCVAIIDRPLAFPPATPAEGAPPNEEDPDTAEQTEEAPSTPEHKAVDTSVLVFPPSSLEGGSTTAAVHAFITGQGSMSAPQGKYIVYLSVPLVDASSSPETTLKPYLDAILHLTEPSTESPEPPAPLYTLFYTQHPLQTALPASENSASDTPTVLLTPDSSITLTESSDAATQAAEALFFKAVDVLRAKRPDLWTVEEGQEESGSGGDVFQEIKTFWPPLERDPDGEPEEWRRTYLKPPISESNSKMHPSLRVAHKPLINFLGKRQWPSTPGPQHAHPAAPEQLKAAFSDFLKKYESSSTASAAGKSGSSTSSSGEQVYGDFWDAPAWTWNPRIRHIEESEIDAVTSGGASLY
ncbi:FAD/NAD(P)-binding domain-containing protein [Dentipellis sp. KUC8613]|nr:FAD/NAD(P)-binding domain-containing protein [Dentipellis sp. KUC8613]